MIVDGDVRNVKRFGNRHVAFETVVVYRHAFRHRLGTAEIESALVSHPAVAESAVVGRPDELKGQAIAAFVTLEGGRTGGEELKQELRNHVADEIGALARPDDIRFTDALPKTRSGKIMRRLLRELASSGTVAGDVTTLEDFSVLEKLREEE